MLCAVPAAAAQAATPPTLSGEELSVAQAGTDFFGATCAAQSLPNTFTESFSFAGTATGPYLGTFVETGALTYTLNPYTVGQPVPPWQSGPISNLTATFTITSPTGYVTGTEYLTYSPTSPAAGCWQSAAAVWLQTDPIPTSYLATITTATGSYQDQGASTVTLASGPGPSGESPSARIDQSFTSSLPESTSPPKITGKATQGQTLAESHGAWTNSPTSYAYQWERCDSTGSSCTAISTATNPTYTLTTADVGSTIRVQEWATNANGTRGPTTSAQTAMVLPLPPANTSSPTVVGTATGGQTLVEFHGSWTNNPTSYSYQWQRCDSSGNYCTSISGAANQSYTVTGFDIGSTVRVQEWATNSGGTGGPATSAATAVVKAAPLPSPQPTSPPSMSGNLFQGQLLTEGHGGWSNSPTIYSYQWLRCDGSGSSCGPIVNATGQTYTPGAADIGGTIRVEEWAADNGGIGGPATSAATGVIQASPTPPSPPPSSSVSGVTTSVPQASPAQIKARVLKELVPSGEAARIAALLKKGGYTLVFNALGAGRLLINWYYLPKGATISRATAKPVLIASGSASFSGPGMVKLTIKLTATGKRMLKATKSMKLTAKGTYTPPGNPAVVANKTFTLGRR